MRLSEISHGKISHAIIYQLKLIFINWNLFFRRRQKKQELSLDEIPPEKLSQEAFRLLRTARSLVNTEEPDLINQINETASQCEEDVEFMVQLAKEFPRTRENSNRASVSYSVCPKLIKPEECKISMAIKRSISLQNDNNQNLDGTVIFDNNCVMSSTFNESLVGRTILKEKVDEKIKTSPPSSNAGSTEDESGFSSMNSYQEIGIPLNGFDKEFMLKRNYKKIEKDVDVQSIDEIKLWQKPEFSSHSHRRWSSTPVDVPTDQPPIKVLWV